MSRLARIAVKALAGLCGKDALVVVLNATVGRTRRRVDNERRCFGAFRSKRAVKASSLGALVSAS